MPLHRIVIATAIWLLAGLPHHTAWCQQSQQPAPDNAQTLRDSFATHVQPLLAKYCYRCHNQEERESGIRVDHLDGSLPDRSLPLWQAIERNITDESMPPADEPQPTAGERKELEKWIQSATRFARSRPQPKNGSARRLTVEQYRHTLRELLGIRDDFASLLPPDAVSADGFANDEKSMLLSPLLIEAYFEVAEKALDATLVDENQKPIIQNFRVDLGRQINPEPYPQPLILGANSDLLPNEDFVVTELEARKDFPFEPFRMQRQFRFIEGYQGNDTVREWREFDSIYHAVFACLRGNPGYPQGLAHQTVPGGLVLRPAIPTSELFGIESTYGPRANFKIALRELPDRGHFLIKVKAARYLGGLLLDAGAKVTPDPDREIIEVPEVTAGSTVKVPAPGIYQVMVETGPVPPDSLEANENKAQPGGDNPYSQPPSPEKPRLLHLVVQTSDSPGKEISGHLVQPAFALIRLPQGNVKLSARYEGERQISGIRLVPVAPRSDGALRYQAFEKRHPKLGVHVGLRRDCGDTLAPVGSPQEVRSDEIEEFEFLGAINNFPNPDVEPDNVNYLAGIREIAVRSEYTDGREMPRLLIQSVEFEGPYYESWPPAAHRAIFFDSPQRDDPPVYARQIIQRFATRAFRRPATQEEVAALHRIFQQSHEDTRDFQASVRDALLVILTSPQFLFLIENSASPKPEPLDEYELASKLAYFLWNSPPDNQTLELAGRQQLRLYLDDEIERLIEDERFERFCETFARQWLSLDKLDVVETDRQKFPRLSREVKVELGKEPAAYLKHLIRDNRPVSELIQSDYLLANEITATYYELDQKPESGWEFVPVRVDRPELGGILGHAGILAGLSDGREANPIKRGAWLARKIIAEPPADPPPNVPDLGQETEHLPLGERLAIHRNQPGCRQCHAGIDPWGLPLEQFDAGGRYQSRPNPQAQSVLPDQTAIPGFLALKNYLAQDRIDQVVFSFVKHLTTYAIGRSLTYNELELLRRKCRELKVREYRMREIVKLVVTSEMFLEK